MELVICNAPHARAARLQVHFKPTIYLLVAINGHDTPADICVVLRQAPVYVGPLTPSKIKAKAELFYNIKSVSIGNVIVLHRGYSKRT